MKRHLLGACCLLLVLGASPGPSLQFLRSARPAARLTLAQARQLTPVACVNVTDPHDGKLHSYQAVRLIPLLEKVYGPRWHEQADLIFSAQDGFETSLTTAQVRAGNPWLAFAAAGGAFRLTNLEQHQVVDLGPFYLVWEHGEPTNQWPYQVIAIDRGRFADRYPGIIPAEGASEAVQRGFTAFRARCIYCHSLKGQGGTSSFDLVSPRNVTLYLPLDYLRAFILKPASFHGRSKMPPLGGPESQIEDLLEYLKTFPDTAP